MTKKTIQFIKFIGLIIGIATISISRIVFAYTLEDKTTMIVNDIVLGNYGLLDKSIEITEVVQTAEGVDVYFKAWDQYGEQIGFGTDGTVEIEHLIIKNPPVYIPDPLGTYERLNKKGEVIERYTLNPGAALLAVIDEAIDRKQEKWDSGNIIPGKIGETTTVIYSSATGDGVIVNNNVFATARAAASGTAGAGTSLDSLGWYTGGGGNLYRAFLPIDIDIPDGETISSSTLSVYGTGVTGTPIIGLILTTQTDATALAGADYDNITLNTPDEGATRVTPSGAGYMHFPLNATGLSWLTDGAYTKFGLRSDDDIDNVNPGSDQYIDIYYADQTGTTQDPFITIESSSSGGGTGSTSTTTLDSATQQYYTNVLLIMVLSILTLDFTRRTFFKHLNLR